MNLRSYGFSLLETLVTVAIMSLLAGIAVPIYQKYKASSIKTAMKTESSELTKFLNYTHSVDGGYHQKIFTMGYKPNRSLIANSGFTKNRNAIPCCARFSPPYNSYLTLTDNIRDPTKVDSAARSEEICSSSGDYCSITDTAVSNPPNRPFTLSTGDSKCRTAFSGQAFSCNCDTFIIYARSFIRGEKASMLANQNGLFCYTEDNTNVVSH